jgi:hypothetical protein
MKSQRAAALGEQTSSPYQYQLPAKRSSPDDFEVANIARGQIVKTLEKFNKEVKASTWQQLGFTHKPTKAKVAEVLQQSTNGDLNDLKVLVDRLETRWKETHGPVSSFFQQSIILTKILKRFMSPLGKCAVLLTITRPSSMSFRHRTTTLRRW